MARKANEELMLLPACMEAELAIPMDQAADAAAEALGLPLLGGPSGSGWSNYSTAQQCPFLWEQTYGRDGERDGRERTKPAEELQIGGLFHNLLALYYGFGLADGAAFYHKRGLLAPSLAEKFGKRGRKTTRDRITISNDAADRLLAYLKAQADPGLLLSGGGEDVIAFPEARPSLTMILEAERIFDAHTNFYGSGQEDVEPLAIEWFAKHPLLGYTCRYDAIVRLGPNDPYVREGALEAGSVLIHERKSARYLSEIALEGWFLDGEILGQLLLWEPSGCERLFGPLAGLVVDVTTKEKVPKFSRILVPKNPVTVREHARGIAYQNAEIALWKATGYFPKRWVSCWRYGRKCGLYTQCRADSASAALEEQVHDG